MIVMPANSTGWFFHCLARETGRIGHLYSPGAERGPWPWFPFALDNGAFSCWDRQKNSFNDKKWNAMLPKWKQLLTWAEPHREQVRWAIVPDIPGDSGRTLRRYGEFVKLIHDLGYPIAIAAGLELWARKLAVPIDCNLTPFVCNEIRRATRLERRVIADRKSGQSFLFD
jgi:hypothetical protein